MNELIASLVFDYVGEGTLLSRDPIAQPTPSFRPGSHDLSSQHSEASVASCQAKKICFDV